MRKRRRWRRQRVTHRSSEGVASRVRRAVQTVRKPKYVKLSSPNCLSLITSLITSFVSTPQITRRPTSTTLSRLLRSMPLAPVHRIFNSIPTIPRRIPVSSRIHTATLSPAWHHFKDSTTRTVDSRNNSNTSQCIRISNGRTLPISLPSPTPLDRSIPSPTSHRILRSSNSRRGAIRLNRRQIGERRTDSLRTADREGWAVDQISQRFRQPTQLVTSSLNAHRNERKDVSLRRTYRLETTRRCHRLENPTTRHISLTTPNPPIPPLCRHDRILVPLRLLDLRRLTLRIALGGVCRISRG